MAGHGKNMELWYKNNPIDIMPAGYYISAQVYAKIMIEE